MPFACSICEEESTRICVRCTKDACDNHLCEKCRKCSDCCECEVRLTDGPAFVAHPVVRPEGPPVPEPPQEQAAAPPAYEPLVEAVASIDVPEVDDFEPPVEIEPATELAQLDLPEPSEPESVSDETSAPPPVDHDGF